MGIVNLHRDPSLRKTPAQPLSMTHTSACRHPPGPRSQGPGSLITQRKPHRHDARDEKRCAVQAQYQQHRSIRHQAQLLPPLFGNDDRNVHPSSPELYRGQITGMAIMG